MSCAASPVLKPRKRDTSDAYIEAKSRFNKGLSKVGNDGRNNIAEPLPRKENVTTYSLDLWNGLLKLDIEALIYFPPTSILSSGGHGTGWAATAFKRDHVIKYRWRREIIFRDLSFRLSSRCEGHCKVLCKILSALSLSVSLLSFLFLISNIFMLLYFVLTMQA